MGRLAVGEAGATDETELTDARQRLGSAAAAVSSPEDLLAGPAEGAAAEAELTRVGLLGLLLAEGRAELCPAPRRADPAGLVARLKPPPEPTTCSAEIGGDTGPAEAGFPRAGGARCAGPVDLGATGVRRDDDIRLRAVALGGTLASAAPEQ